MNNSNEPYILTACGSASDSWCTKITEFWLKVYIPVVHQRMFSRFIIVVRSSVVWKAQSQHHVATVQMNSNVQTITKHTNSHWSNRELHTTKRTKGMCIYVLVVNNGRSIWPPAFGHTRIVSLVFKLDCNV